MLLIILRKRLKKLEMYKYFFKRLFDIIFAMIILPIFIITTLIIGPIIYFSDRGNIFYVSYRLGKNGKEFKMIKFRSMKVNAPDIRNEDGSTFNSEDDNRVTSIGKFIRKTSIDEIPQILNVLVGSMSIIGPRPTMADFKIEKYEEEHKKRFNVKPGITGYSQAYFRNSISQEEQFDNDVFYSKKISFWLDIKIFFKTILTVIKKDNVNRVKDK